MCSSQTGSSRCQTFPSAGDYEHAGDIVEWITQQQDDVPEDRFDADCTAAGMGRTSKRPHEVCWVLVHGTEQSYRWNTTSIGEKRTTPRWSERLGSVEYAPVTSATAQGFMKKSLDIPRAKTT